MSGAPTQEDALLKQRIVSALGRRKIGTAALVSVAALSSFGIAHRDAPVNPDAPTVVQNAQFLTTATANALATPVLAEPVSTGAEKVGLPDIENPRVESWIKRFTTDLRGSFATYLDRMTRYEPMIAEKLERGRYGCALRRQPSEKLVDACTSRERRRRLAYAIVTF